jgi:hypothetical protein
VGYQRRAVDLDSQKNFNSLTNDFFLNVSFRNPVSFSNANSWHVKKKLIHIGKYFPGAHACTMIWTMIAILLFPMVLFDILSDFCTSRNFGKSTLRLFDRSSDLTVYQGGKKINEKVGFSLSFL